MPSIPKKWKLTQIAGALGAQLSGVNLTKPSKKELQLIQKLLHEYKVLFFPGQEISPEQHIRFTQRLADLEGGTLEGHPNLGGNSDLPPEIFELKASTGGVADEWHTDLTFQESPAIFSVLHMVTCPEMGGDTMWTSLDAAYDALSEPVKELCDGLTALHDALPHNRPMQMAIHPVVRVHPVTGKKALYVNEHFTRRIVEMNGSESENFLNYLTKWVSSPQFTLRYRWKPGTVAIWDNRCTQHYVLNDFEGERIIQRVSVVGDEVRGVGELHTGEPDDESVALATRWQPWVRSGRLTATSRHDRQLYLHLKSKGLIKKS